jgi:hypothetical protein
VAVYLETAAAALLRLRNGRIRDFDILELVLADGFQCVDVCSTSDISNHPFYGDLCERTYGSCKGKHAGAEQGVLEEIWPARADERRGLPPVAVVVGVLVDARYILAKCQRICTPWSKDISPCHL